MEGAKYAYKATANGVSVNMAPRFFGLLFSIFIFSDVLAKLAPNMHESKSRGGRDDSVHPKINQNRAILGHFWLLQSFEEPSLVEARFAEPPLTSTFGY